LEVNSQIGTPELLQLGGSVIYQLLISYFSSMITPESVPFAIVHADLVLETRILGIDFRNEDLRILGFRGFLISSSVRNDTY